MKSLFIPITIFLVLILHSCSWSFDPSVPYPNLEIDEYWIDKFDQKGLQHARIISDKLFCNTVNISEGQNFLYCLSLKTGKVLWKVPVDTYASQPVEVYKNNLYFSTYVGDIYKMSMDEMVL